MCNTSINKNNFMTKTNEKELIANMLQLKTAYKVNEKNKEDF